MKAYGMALDKSIAKITKIYTRTYRDSGQVTTYVEGVDDDGKPFRTEGKSNNSHMHALIERGRREGVTPTKETW